MYQSIRYGLPLQFETLGDVMGDAGYETYFFGKWNLGLVTPQVITRRRHDTGVSSRLISWSSSAARRPDDRPRAVADPLLYFVPTERRRPPPPPPRRSFLSRARRENVSRQHLAGARGFDYWVEFHDVMEYYYTHELCSAYDGTTCVSASPRAAFFFVWLLARLV